MKRMTFYLLVVIVGLGLVAWLFEFLTTGTVTLTSNDPNIQLSIAKVGDASSAKTGTRSLTARFKSGNYIAWAAGNSKGTSRIIKVQAHKSSRYNLDPPPPVGTEPVLYQQTSFVTAGPNQLFFMNMNDQSLYKVDGQNNVTRVSSTRFIEAKWISSSEGVAEDDAGRLYAIHNGSVEQLSLPVPGVTNFDIAPGDVVFFAADKQVYKGNLSGNFSKIYTSDDPFTSLAASRNGVALISSPLAETSKSYKTFVAFISNSGSITKRSIVAYDGSVWSPDGQYMATAGNLDYEIFSSSLEKVADLPAKAVSNLAWIDNDRLIYSIRDQLWIYDVKTETAKLLANMPLGGVISQTSVSDGGDYAYLTVAGLNGASGSLKRVGLKGQVAANIVYQLQDILPKNLEDCSIGLVNFTAPTVIVSTSSPDLSALCMKAAGDELSQSGFNLNQLQLKPAS